MVDNRPSVTSALTLMDPRVSDPAATWRNQLAAFLRARRAELHPEDVGGESGTTVH